MKVNLNGNGLTVVKGQVGYATVRLLYIPTCCNFIKTVVRAINRLYIFLINIINLFLGFAFVKTE